MSGRSRSRQRSVRPKYAQPEAARTLLVELRAKPGKRSRLTLRALCQSLVPEIERVPVKDVEPLPDIAGLAQLRRDLQTLPRPLLEPRDRGARGRSK